MDWSEIYTRGLSHFSHLNVPFWSRSAIFKMVAGALPVFPKMRNMLKSVFISNFRSNLIVTTYLTHFRHEHGERSISRWLMGYFLFERDQNASYTCIIAVVETLQVEFYHTECTLPPTLGELSCKQKDAFVFALQKHPI